MARIAGRFARVEPRRRVRRLVLGLLSHLPRKNCWTIATWAGKSTPDGMQHLLSRAKWYADAVRDALRGYVVEHLHDERAVLVVDETGDVMKGVGTVGVQRHYTGTAGRIENAQVAVYQRRRAHPAPELTREAPRAVRSVRVRSRERSPGATRRRPQHPQAQARLRKRQCMRRDFALPSAVPLCSANDINTKLRSTSCWPCH